MVVSNTVLAIIACAQSLCSHGQNKKMQLCCTSCSLICGGWKPSDIQMYKTKMHEKEIACNACLMLSFIMFFYCYINRSLFLLM